MSKDDSKGSDGAGVAGISRNDIFVEANASNIEGNSNLLRDPTFSGSDNRNETFLPNREGMIRKLLSQKRQLTIDLKQFIDKLKSTKKSKLTDVVSNFHEIESSYYEFKEVLGNLEDPELMTDVMDGIADLYEQCHVLYDKFNASSNACSGLNLEDTLDSSDSASQTTRRSRSTSSTFKARQIELEYQRIELEASRDLARAKANAAAAEAKAVAEAAEADARFRVEKAKLETEERLPSLSECGSAVGGSWRRGLEARSGTDSHRGLSKKKRGTISDKDFPLDGAYPDDSSERGCLAGGADVRAHNHGEAYAAQPNAPKIEKNVRHGTEPNLGVGGGGTASRPEQFFKLSRGAPDFNAGDYTKPAMTFKLPTAVGNASSNDNYYNTAYQSESVFTTYLERQARNEYVNLASQIGYDGHNIAFILYENQIRALMAESPCQERRLEILRASCSGQPRETVNLFLAPMRNLSTSERIEKALDRLRQRYGVSGGLTTEPLVGAIRNGSKISFNAASLKLFNEDLNTLEVFAYAHNEVEKLSGQLLMDVANRLPGVLKRRYLDHLSHKRLDLNPPGFDSLREFIAYELSVITSDYAQSFFKNDQTEKSRDHGAVIGRGSAVGVRSAVISSAKLPHNSENAKRGRFNSGETQNSGRPSPICFVCNDPKLRHYLGECKKFQTLTNENKRRAVIDAGRCLTACQLTILPKIVQKDRNANCVGLSQNINMLLRYTVCLRSLVLVTLGPLMLDALKSLQ